MSVFKYISQHPAGSRNHEVAREDRVAHSIELVGSNLGSTAVRLVYDVILQETSVVGNFYAGWKSLHLLVYEASFKVLSFKLWMIFKDWPRKHEHDSWPEVLPLKIHVIQGRVFHWLEITLELQPIYVNERMKVVTIVLMANSLVFIKSFSTSIKGSSLTFTCDFNFSSNCSFAASCSTLSTRPN